MVPKKQRKYPTEEKTTTPQGKKDYMRRYMREYRRKERELIKLARALVKGHKPKKEGRKT